MIYFEKPTNEIVESKLAHQKTLASGSYNFDELIVQLDLDFSRKCYICEGKVKAIRIEHFRPQFLGINEKFDWFNIYNACEHCNAIKSDDYLNLMDCTREYPDQHIRFEVTPLNPIGKQVTLSLVAGSTQPQAVLDDTLSLLNSIYSGSNKRKQIESEVIVEELLEELNDFGDLLDDYLAEPDDEDLEDIKTEVNNSSKFTAFKRWKVKNDTTYNQQFSQYFIN